MKGWDVVASVKRTQFRAEACESVRSILAAAWLGKEERATGLKRVELG